MAEIHGIDYYLIAQEEFQKLVPGGVVDRKLTDAITTMESVRTQMLALENELHEALAETGWKPWASSNHINDDRFRDELIDAFRFFMNLVIISGMSPSDFHNRFNASMQKSMKRLRNGYDGVTDKCPGCKRAYDDTSVRCARPPARTPFPTAPESSAAAQGIVWCQVYGHINAMGHGVVFNGKVWTEGKE